MIGALTAAVFDVDGVLTDTRELHIRAWTALFDELVDPLVPPFSQVDYERLVDGRPRLDGLRSVLADRGRLDDRSEDNDQLDRLAARKQLLFRDLVQRHGVQVFGDVRPCLARLRAGGLALAAASASRNAEPNLRGAGLAALVDVIVDGAEAARLGLAGKPAPDLFLEAAHRLGVAAADAVLVEDSQAGLEAGRRGGFGLVVALDRSAADDGDLAQRADLVIASLDELTLSSEVRGR